MTKYIPTWQKQKRSNKLPGFSSRICPTKTERFCDHSHQVSLKVLSKEIVHDFVNAPTHFVIRD